MAREFGVTTLFSSIFKYNPEDENDNHNLEKNSNLLS